MRKKSLLAVLMAMVLLLSGCSTIIVKDQEVEDATPILTLGDEVITRKDVINTRDNVLLNQYYMYASYGIDPAQLGFDISNPDTIAAALSPRRASGSPMTATSLTLGFARTKSSICTG